VDVLRSSGGWTPAKVTDVNETGFVVIYDDESGQKEIPFELSATYLRTRS
jgi:hypothetical protein